MKKYIKEKFPLMAGILIIIKDLFVGFYRKSYSQFGEDLVLSSFFNMDKTKNGFYVDIGAYKPKKFSNSYFFYKKGWSGINIDAKPGSMKLFRKERKRDINLECGVFKDEKKLDFYLFREPAYNTFSKELADTYILNGVLFDKKINVDTFKLEHIFDKYLPINKKIDFFSIDVEGLDLDVLESNNWEKYRPTYVLVEIHNFDIINIIKSNTYKFLVGKGYKLVSIAYITLIFKYEQTI